MLIKSVKHDLMATYRDFVGIYVALLVASIIGPFVIQVNNGIVFFIAIMVLSGLTIATLIITFLTIIRLYNRRLFSNEGYLTMTLPVKTHITIISKVITGMIWSFATSMVFFGAALIFYGIYSVLYNVLGWTNLGEFINFLNEVASQLFRWDVISALLIQAPLTIVSGAKDLILLVFIMTFVNTSFIKKGKLAIGVAAYMILGSIFTWILTGALMLVGGVAYVSSGSGSVLINGFELGGALNMVVYGVQFSLTSVFILILGFASWWLLEHKLEVE
jgi:hypothetical protein